MLSRVKAIWQRLHLWLGRLLAALVVAMVAIGAYNALARYVGRWLGANLGSNRWLELQWYLFSLVFLLGATYALERGAHVRVDVLYARLSTRARATIDALGTALLLIPFCLFGLVVNWRWVANSWAVLERSADPGGLARYPLKTMVLVAWALLLVQACVELARAIRKVRA